MYIEKTYDYVHAFISTSKEAVTWGFWHAARSIYLQSRQGSISLTPFDEQRISAARRLVRLFIRRREDKTKQQMVPIQCGINLRYGGEYHAILLMYRGLKNALVDKQIESIIGLNTEKQPFIRRILAKGPREIDWLLKELFNMRMLPQTTYEGGDSTPDELALKYSPPPDDLHPSKWSQLSLNTHELKHPKF